MRFSERHGFKPVRDAIQVEAMDDALRNGLWSVLKIRCWDDVRRTHWGYSLAQNESHQKLCAALWLNHFKLPLDDLEDRWLDVLDRLRKHFFNCPWYEVYDFVEFVAHNYRGNSFKDAFTNDCNIILEREMSAYRFVGGVITEVTNQQEIEEIEQAVSESSDPVSAHLRRALELMSNREAPDYRNSIKESISAVESQVIAHTGSKKGTLGQLLKQLEEKSGLHRAVTSAFGSLYGYTSDEGGIRHAMTEQDNVDFHDAKFMLVICSAFINFAEGKRQDKG